jgi:hypothetical protein
MNSITEEQVEELKIENAKLKRFLFQAVGFVNELKEEYRECDDEYIECSDWISEVREYIV